MHTLHPHQNLWVCMCWQDSEAAEVLPCDTNIRGACRYLSCISPGHILSLTHMSRMKCHAEHGRTAADAPARPTGSGKARDEAPKGSRAPHADTGSVPDGQICDWDQCMRLATGFYSNLSPHTTPVAEVQG